MHLGGRDSAGKQAALHRPPHPPPRAGAASPRTRSRGDVFGVDNPARHRAFGDALATAHILRALIGRARERGVETLERLIELHDRPRHRVRNAECRVRSVNAYVEGPPTSHANSASRTPHSALE